VFKELSLGNSHGKKLAGEDLMCDLYVEMVINKSIKMEKAYVGTIAAESIKLLTACFTFS
jgi:hypothetical protein